MNFEKVLWRILPTMNEIDNFFSHMELLMPDIIRSPTWVLNNQRGNCFEFSTLLVSLLRGQSYNAFVVSGYASREQTQCNTSMIDCPYVAKSTEPTVRSIVTTDVPKYSLKPPPDFKSKLLTALEEEEEKKQQVEADRERDARQKAIDEQERLADDKYWGHRIHSWVVLLPETINACHSDITDPIFIEPTTGQNYTLGDSKINLLYHGIESIWSDSNYWVNMQPCANGCTDMQWKINDNQLWEHLLPGEPWTMRDIEETKEDEKWHILQDKHLDMPTSYVQQIKIHSLDYERRFPNGRKTMMFKKARVELYAPYVQMDGLVEKVSLYEDYECQMLSRIYEKYSNRGDKLTQSEKFLDSGYVVDVYSRGRSDSLKLHRYLSVGNNTIEDERTMEFYHVVRIDGLSKIELHPLHFSQYFVDRKDLLHYRNVQFATENGVVSRNINQRVIWKIIEEFNRNEELSATKDIAIREFRIGNNEIHLRYHYKDDDITRVTRTFIKPPDSERGDRLVYDPRLTYGYNPNPLAHPEKSVDLFHLLKNQLENEEQSIIHVRDTERMIITLLESRSTEYSLPRLTVSMFDENRNDDARIGMLAQEQIMQAQRQRDVEADVDYLQPYLIRLGNPEQLTKTQALQVRDECLNDFKQSLVTRANNIWQKLEDNKQKLEKLQQMALSDNLSKEEAECIVSETNAVNFDMHALDVRLKRHCDLSSLRYRSMAETLQKDKRLSSLYEN